VVGELRKLSDSSVLSGKKSHREPEELSVISTLVVKISTLGVVELGLVVRRAG
jgi:hypothetical protein